MPTNALVDEQRVRDAMLAAEGERRRWVRELHDETLVDEDGGVLRASVGDDGRGFDSGTPTDRFGISGMRERAALLHGELEIASSAGGTVVTATLPNS